MCRGRKGRKKKREEIVESNNIHVVQIATPLLSTFSQSSLAGKRFGRFHTHSYIPIGLTYSRMLVSNQCRVCPSTKNQILARTKVYPWQALNTPFPMFVCLEKPTENFCSHARLSRHRTFIDLLCFVFRGAKPKMKMHSTHVGNRGRDENMKKGKLSSELVCVSAGHLSVPVPRIAEKLVLETGSRLH